MDDLPKSLLWCYDDERQWFLVGLYLALTSSSFFEIFIFIFFLRITFFDPVSKNASMELSAPVSLDPALADAAVEESPTYPRRRKSNAQTVAAEELYCNRCRLSL